MSSGRYVQMVQAAAMRFPLELAEISKAVSADSTHRLWSDVVKRSMYPVRVVVPAEVHQFLHQYPGISDQHLIK